MGDVFAAHAHVLTPAGYQGYLLGARGYTMGATYSPTSMAELVICAGNDQVLTPSMLFVIRMILLNSKTGLSISWERLPL